MDKSRGERISWRGRVNTGPYAALLASLNENWRDRKPEFELRITEGELHNAEAHPLHGELLALCSRRAASLPYFGDQDIIWCTLAPCSNDLRQAVVALRAWILPSFGGENPDDGFVPPGALEVDSRQQYLLFRLTVTFDGGAKSAISNR